MTNFTITIEAPAVAEAINHLADAIAGGARRGTTPIISCPDKPEPVLVQPQSQEMPAGPALAPMGVAAPTQAPPTAAPVQTATPSMPEPVSAPAPAEPTYTLDDLARAASRLIDEGKMEQIIAIVSKYGVQAINQIDPKQYPAFAADIRAIGASI